MPKGLRVRLPPSAPLMSRIKNILRSIRIEEYILFIFSLILFSIYFVLASYSFHWSNFESGFKIIAFGAKHFIFSLAFIFYYAFFKLYLFLARRVDYFIGKRKISKSINFSWKKLFFEITIKINKFLRSVFFFLRPLFSITIFLSSMSLLLGFLAGRLRGELIDVWLMELDKSITGFYPFLYSYDNPFSKSMALLLILPYALLGAAMGFSWIIFYIDRRKKILSRYILAMSIAPMISLPVWFFFPANSPHFLNNIYNPEYLDGTYYDQKTDFSIKEIVNNHLADQRVLDFNNRAGVGQTGVAPISTAPSMHVAWAIIIVYYLFKFRRKTIYFTLPWAIFSSLGAVYLGQHYFIDVLVSLPVAFIAIGLTGYLFKIEKRYYRANRLLSF